MLVYFILKILMLKLALLDHHYLLLIFGLVFALLRKNLDMLRRAFISGKCIQEKPWTSLILPSNILLCRLNTECLFEGSWDVGIGASQWNSRLTTNQIRKAEFDLRYRKINMWNSLCYCFPYWCTQKFLLLDNGWDRKVVCFVKKLFNLGLFQTSIVSILNRLSCFYIELWEQLWIKCIRHIMHISLALSILFYLLSVVFEVKLGVWIHYSLKHVWFLMFVG